MVACSENENLQTWPADECIDDVVVILLSRVCIDEPCRIELNCCGTFNSITWMWCRSSCKHVVVVLRFVTVAEA